MLYLNMKRAQTRQRRNKAHVFASQRSTLDMTTARQPMKQIASCMVQPPRMYRKREQTRRKVPTTAGSRWLRQPKTSDHKNKPRMHTQHVFIFSRIIFEKLMQD